MRRRRRIARTYEVGLREARSAHIPNVAFGRLDLDIAAALAGTACLAMVTVSRSFALALTRLRHAAGRSLALMSSRTMLPATGFSMFETLSSTRAGQCASLDAAVYPA